MSKSLKTASLKFATLAVDLACATQAMAVDLTVVSLGGVNKSAQIKVFYEPYQKATGNRIVAGEYNGEMAKAKAMVDTNSVSWDLMKVESPELSRGCDEGLFEGLDLAQFGKIGDLVPGATQSCGVGFFVWFTVLVYNADKLKSVSASWVDFWGIKKFPGKRDLCKGTKYTLEFALVTDGVVPKDVYGVLVIKENQDRAFKKPDEIEPSIQWRRAGVQPLQYLAFGDVVMSPAHNGRIAAVQKESNLKVVWNGGIYDFDAWATPKRAKKQEEILKFIVFLVQSQQQKTYPEDITHGPANKQAVPLPDKALLKDMPAILENIRNQVAMDVTFWTGYGEQLEQRFDAWAVR